MAYRLSGLRPTRSQAALFSVTLGLSAAVALIPAAQADAALSSLPSNCVESGTAGLTVTCTFSFTGANQSFTVPVGVKSLDVKAVGAAGGAGGLSGGGGGQGASVEDTAVSVTPGQVLTVVVGGKGGSGGDTLGGAGGVPGAGGPAGDYPTAHPQAEGDGGGGGGYSGLLNASNPLVIAAAGGGGGGFDTGGHGGAGGGGAGGNGIEGRGGGGATGTAGGTAGSAQTSCGTAGQTGASLAGGMGGNTEALVASSGGGGGGGYYGGGGGGAGCISGGGGGGGSNFGVGTLTNVSNTSAAASVTLTFTDVEAALAELHQTVESFGGFDNTMALAVSIAENAVAAGNTELACQSMNVFIQDVVQAPASARAGLIADAEAIRAALGC